MRNNQTPNKQLLSPFLLSSSLFFLTEKGKKEEEKTTKQQSRGVWCGRGGGWCWDVMPVFEIIITKKEIGREKGTRGKKRRRGKE